MNSKAGSSSKIEYDKSGSKTEAYKNNSNKKCAPKLLFLIEEKKNQKDSDDHFESQILAYFDELSAFEFTMYRGFLGVCSFLAKNLAF